VTTLNGHAPAAGPDDERALLRKCCSGQAGAWEQFLVRYNKLIYYSIHRTCAGRHYRADADEVEDLFSEVLVHFIKDDFKKLRLYRGDEGCSGATWIRTITVRYTIDYLRSRSRQQERVDIDGEDIGLEVSLKNPVTQPDQVFENQEEDRLMSEAIARLPENDRYFIELYYGRGLSPDQTARVLGLSTKSVYSRVNRLKAKLTEEIEKPARK
jgi:RNA polymerase sigma-70 factor (ECF subfamily)